MNRRESLTLGASIMVGASVAPLLHAAEAAPGGNATDSFWEVVKNRRSVRDFKPDPVPEEHLLKIVDAARMAPCAGNEQPWKFLIVRDKKKIEALKTEWIKHIEAGLKANGNLSAEVLQAELQKYVSQAVTGRMSAPAYIVVLTDGQRKYPDYNQYDGPLAAGYLLLAARALGYGTVFLTDSIPVEVTRKVFNIPDRYVRVCITPVGVPVAWPKQEKKPLAEVIVKDSF